MRSVKGIFRNGRVELLEKPSGVAEETLAVVTFPLPGHVDLAERGLNETQAADLRARLAQFTEDWSSPEMDAYDHYDEHRGA